jgi:alpha-beta hydrolase superfamily lysophospholipase
MTNKIRISIAFAVLASGVAAAASNQLTRKAQGGITFSAANGELVLAEVRQNQNAARDGLKAGDVVLRVDGAEAHPEAKLARALMRRPVGDRVDYLVRRDGREIHVVVEYRAAPLEHAEGIDIQYRSVETDGHLRRVLVTAPKRAGRFPAVLWIAGSGCGSQEAPNGGDPVVEFLYNLTRRGYVTVRVEKTGVGDSDGPPCYSDSGGIGQEVRGYIAALKALTSYDAVDPERIYLFGHSAGTSLAPLVARNNPIRGIVAAGAMGTNFFDYIFAMRRKELELAGKPVAEIEASMAITKICTARLLRDRRTPDDVEQEMPDCRHRVRYDSPPPYIQDLADLDLQKAWSETPDAPVLVLYGAGDFVTSEGESRALVNTINKVHPGRASLQVLPMDHGFLAFGSQQDAWAAEQAKDGRGQIYPKLTDVVAQFFKEHQ